MCLQDGQEFLKLLLSKLEAVFGASQREVRSTLDLHAPAHVKAQYRPVWNLAAGASEYHRYLRGPFMAASTCAVCKLPISAPSEKAPLLLLSLLLPCRTWPLWFRGCSRATCRM
jgi:hypothetical protein